MELGKLLLAELKQVGPVDLGDSGILPTNDGSDLLDFLLSQMVPMLTNFVLGATISVAVIMIMVGGIMFIFSGGDQEKRTKGRDFILWAMIGLAVAVLAYAIVKLLLQVEFITSTP